MDDGILFERIELNFRRIKVNSWEIDIYKREIVWINLVLEISA